MRLVVITACGALLTGCLSLPRQAPPTRTPDTGSPPAAAAPSYVVFGQRYYPMADATGYRDRGVASWYGAKFHGRDTSSGERYDMYGMTAAHKTLPLPTWVRVTNLRNGASVVVKVNDRGPFVKNRLIDLSYEAARRIGMIGDGTTLVEVEAIPAPPATLTVEVSAPASAATVAAPAPSAPATVVAAPVTVATGVTEAGGQDHGVHDAGEATEAEVIESLSYETASPADSPAFDSPPPAEAAATQDQPGAPRIFVQVGAFGDFANAQRLREALYNASIDNVRLANAERDGLPIFRVQVGPVTDVADYDMLIARLQTLGISETHLITE